MKLGIYLELWSQLKMFDTCSSAVEMSVTDVMVSWIMTAWTNLDFWIFADYTENSAWRYICIQYKIKKYLWSDHLKASLSSSYYTQDQFNDQIRPSYLFSLHHFTIVQTSVGIGRSTGIFGSLLCRIWRQRRYHRRHSTLETGTGKTLMKGLTGMLVKTTIHVHWVIGRLKNGNVRGYKYDVFNEFYRKHGYRIKIGTILSSVF